MVHSPETEALMKRQEAELEEAELKLMGRIWIEDFRGTVWRQKSERAG